MTPTWMLDLLAALMLVVAAVSAARLAAARPWRRGSMIIDTDVAHLLMGIAMAGALTSRLSTLPDAAWEVIFGLMIGWFAVRVARDARTSGVRALAGGHCAPHLAHSAAMLYMFLGMAPTSGAMAGMPGMPAGASPMLMLSDPTLAFAFALALIGYSVRDLDQLSGRRYNLSARVTLAGIQAGVPAPVIPAPVIPAPAIPAPVIPAPAIAGRAALSGPDPVGTPASASAPAPAGADAAAPYGEADGPAVDHDTAAERHRPAGALGRFLLSPAVTIGCRVTMGVVMTFMLLTAI